MLFPLSFFRTSFSIHCLPYNTLQAVKFSYLSHAIFRETVFPSGSYDAADFENLPVSAEVKELFQFIDAFQPQTVEIEPQLRPFILDYIPAVGDIDAFIKIPRPDGVSTVYFQYETSKS